MLHTPVTLGEIALKNRIVMAPMTRCRAEPGRVPGRLMVDYYTQRAGAGLILTEATSVCADGVGYPDTPGLWSAEQVAGWRAVTGAVHAAGGRIVAQLWHVGRLSDPFYLDGRAPLAPSALAAPGDVSLLRPKRPYPVPRAMTEADIATTIAAFATAAANAKAAGFDGVEIHAANGFLLDQFLRDGTNQRADRWGGSIANRCRLTLAVAEAVTAHWGGGRVGVHIAPRYSGNGMSDSDPQALYTHLLRELSARGTGFVFLREGKRDDGLLPALRAAFTGQMVINQDLTVAEAEALIKAGRADAAAWGKPFIANPDLPARLAAGAPLAAPDAATFYEADPPGQGYTDYPALETAG